MSVPTLEPLGDGALLVRWHDDDEVASNRRVHALAARVRAERPAWLLDCVPAYATLALHFEPAAVAPADRGVDPAATVAAWVSTRAPATDATTAIETARVVEIPVCYGGEFGPDLDDVARACGFAAAEVVQRHAGGDYRVAMLGYSPGFPYLLGLDPALASPRLATPRLRVPAGSVGIGGRQTGIYPDAGPGGWRLIGRTPRRLFDAQRTPPSVLLPGDRLRFVPIDATRFAALQDEQP
jgi:KipI family sensor histidine kinase inhibitor